jgi:RHS repeat-associated protein
LQSEQQGEVGKTVAYAYDLEGHRTAMNVTGVPTDAAPDWQTQYSYDEAGRLELLLDPRISATDPFRYTWKDNANLLTAISTPLGGATTKSYDFGGRLTNISATHGSTAINSYSYSYDAASQRTKETASVGVRKFGYDEKRQLTSVARVTGSDEVPDPTHQYGFTYDPIGNRQTATTNGASTSYTANNVNQYTQIAAATPAHDDNGNETTDGAGKTFEWDEENRLAAVVQGSTRSEYRYDGLSRRVEKRVYQDGQLTIHRRFLYDGWNLLAELTLTGPTETIERTYTWGLDLSLTPQGAGGVGGLLAAKDNTGAFSYHYDGNGNVTELVDTDGAVTAHYEYGPFGEVIRASGAYASSNPFGFSTKFLDSESGYAYFGYRFYSLSDGRWISRDPVGKRGGPNLYSFNYNSPLAYVDPLGLTPIGKGCCTEANVDKVAAEYSRKAAAKTLADPARREFGGLICCKNGTVRATEPHPGTIPIFYELPSGRRTYSNATVDPHIDLTGGRRRIVSCNELFWFGGAIEVATYHSHLDNSKFSPEDTLYADQTGAPLYKGTPNDRVERADPDPNYNPKIKGSGGRGPIKTIP